MKGILMAAVLAAGGAAALRAGVNVQVNIGPAPYYGYAPHEVVYVERYVPAYDVPRVFVVSRYAHVHPSVVVGYYRNGWGWDRIYRRYHVPAHVVYPGRGYYAAPYRGYYPAPYSGFVKKHKHGHGRR
jgi:hypothetical protein